MAAPSDKDKLFEDYLGGDSRLSKAYREASDELPPAELDSRILSEARKAVEPEAPHPAGPFSGRWMLPASLAVIVLAVSVVVLLPYGQSPLEYRPEPLTAPAPAPPAEPAAIPPSYGGSVISGGKLEQRKERRPEAAKQSSPALSEDAPAAGLRHAPDALRYDAGPSSLPEPAPRRSRPAERLERAISGEGRLMEETLREDRQRESAAGEAEAARRLQSRPLSAPSREPAAPQADAASPAPLELGDSVRADPAAWLDFIRRLIDAGRPEEAARQLETFQRQFPDHPVPAEILSSLETRRP